jgi:2-dehydro-3-deoxyphosphogluconate aldolase / (4S)-4-hydroxy-2-oxoglutarate aldolase
MKTLEDKLADIKIMPIIAIDNADKAVQLSKVLIENGMPCAEVTFRTSAAAQTIKNMRSAYPDMLICSGTVLTTKQVDQSIDAGVDFIVSPGLNPNIVRYCQEKGIAIIPGINSPSLIEQAMDLGLTTLKFFPAEPSGGVAMLKSLTSVYPVKIMPTGGITPKNLHSYLDIPAVFACGGTWMIPKDLINNDKWEDLGVLVKEAVSLVN